MQGSSTYRLVLVSYERYSSVRYVYFLQCNRARFRADSRSRAARLSVRP